jgi:hypothetical protein
LPRAGPEDHRYDIGALLELAQQQRHVLGVVLEIGIECDDGIINAGHQRRSLPSIVAKSMTLISLCAAAALASLSADLSVLPSSTKIISNSSFVAPGYIVDDYIASLRSVPNDT